MDKRDEDIIKLLKKNGRASYTDIAEEVGVSEGTVRNRVDKLKENGIIEKFTVDVSTNQSKAVVMVILQTGKDIDIVLSNFPEEITIQEIAGKYDLVLHIERSSNEEINSVLDEIRSIEGVDSTETYMVLNQRG